MVVLVVRHIEARFSDQRNRNHNKTIVVFICHTTDTPMTAMACLSAKRSASAPKMAS
jgi:hypothetical protein